MRFLVRERNCLAAKASAQYRSARFPPEFASVSSEQVLPDPSAGPAPAVTDGSSPMARRAPGAAFRRLAAPARNLLNHDGKNLLHEGFEHSERWPIPSPSCSSSPATS
jgi:hypothetical protein